MVLKIFKNEMFQVEVKTSDGESLFDVETVARSLGFVETKRGKEYVRWRTVNGYLKEYISQEVAKGDFIPEAMVYKLAFKANNKTAEDFQDWLALEVLPEIRKTGSYSGSPISNPNLSPELQIMQGLLNQMATQEQAIADNQRDNQRIEHKVDSISEIVAIDSRDWRNKTNSILRKIAIKQGGFDMYQEIGNESYMRLEKRGRCNLDIRLENRRKNMIAQGVGKYKVKKLNKLDIIADDSRLTEIYLSVVKDMAIKYGVHLEEEIVQEA